VHEEQQYFILNMTEIHFTSLCYFKLANVTCFGNG